MNEFTIGFEVEFSGTSERFVSEEAYKTQQKLKDEYMSRDTKHMETISELREQLAAKQDYIKTLEERNENQKKEITNLLKKQEKLKAEIVTKSNIISSRDAACNRLTAKIMELNQGIRNSADLTWKEKYDELKEKYTADSTSFNGVMNELRKRLKNNNDQNNMTCKKLADDLAYITDRCSKAEHTINAIKEILKEE